MERITPKVRKYLKRSEAPFSPSKEKKIVAEFRKLHADSDLLGRLKRWPKAMALKAIEAKPFLRGEIIETGILHEKNRQEILDQMRYIVINSAKGKGKGLSKRKKSLKSPLELLFEFEDKTYRKLQAMINRRKEYRFLRKYFPGMLPKRKYKPKGHTGNRYWKKKLYDLRRKEQKMQNAINNVCKF